MAFGRDVTGGDETLGALVPGYNLFTYVLGWISVPIETFLRRDFGERYYTKPNFFAGIVVLVLFNFSASIGRMFGRTTGDDEGSLMGKVLLLYFIIGIIHFLVIWWREIMGTARFSYDAGRSWLNPLGRLIMGFLNLFLNAFARLLVSIVAPDKKKQLEKGLPVLSDVGTFTERFVEPFVVLILGITAMSMEQVAIGLWCFLSVMALSLVTGLKHQAERGYVLDIRDQMIELHAMRKISEGKEPTEFEQMRRVVNETAEQVEKYPETLDVIKNRNPSLADAIRAMRAKHKTNQENLQES